MLCAICRFRGSALRTLRKFQTGDLHALLPALGIPSDYVCVSDGVTPSDGTPIHVHLVLQEGRGGQLQYQVLGLQPVAVAAMLPAALHCASALKFSTRDALVAHAREVERQFGLQMQANVRWAGRVADGAEEGIAELQASQLGFAKPQMDLFGQIDIWHCCETAGFHADMLSTLQGNTWKDQYLDVTRRVRGKYNFGVHRFLPKAIAKKFGAPCVALLAPHSQATRTVKHEAVLAAKNFLYNVRNLTFCAMVALQASINSARQVAHNPGPGCGLFTEASKSCREDGRMVLNVPLLLYVTLRQEHREACITSYATAGQRITTTSSEAFRMQLSCLRRMRLCQAAARGLCGVVEIWDRILDCLAGTEIPRAQRLTQSSLHAFVMVLAHKVCCKQFPKGSARVLEVIRHRTIFGLPCGLQRGTLHPFSEPIRISDVEGKAALQARQRETTQMCRKRLVSEVMPALLGFLAHTRNEIALFKSRCLFHFSTWPLRTSNDIWQVMGGRKASNQEGVVAESVVMYDGNNEEEAPAFDPSTSTQHSVFDALRSEGNGLVELEQPGPPEAEVPNEEDAAPDADNISVPELAGQRFALPCDSDGVLAETMRRGGQSKAALLGSGLEML